MTTHIMIDLETLSTRANATIISIGAVAFDPLSAGVFERFHVAINPSAQGENRLFDIDPSTVMWWMQQDCAEARDHWNAMQKVDLATALAGFSAWMEAQVPSSVIADDDGVKSLPVWGNGASFDNVILRRSYELLGMIPPWRFWDDRCYRTIKNLIRVPMPEVVPLAGGVLHSALYDAERQALHLQAMMREPVMVPR